MKIYSLLFLKTLLIINTSESPYERTVKNLSKNNFISGNNYLSNHHNSQFNEVHSNNVRNHSNFSNIEDNFQPSIKISNDNIHRTERLNHQETQPSVPVAATLELPGSQKFSDVPISVNNVPVSINGDKIIFPDDPGILSNNNNYTKEEIACFKQSKVYHNESCEEILNDQNCDKGEWLVLDLNSIYQSPPKIKPACTKKLCKVGEYYWPETKKCYENINLNYEMFCPPGNEFGYDFFGFGTCVCQGAYGLHNSSTCYPLYTQGPCSKGYLFIENDSTHTTECKQNLCQNPDLVPYYKNRSNLCYELGTQGPCQPNFTFQVSKEARKPMCSDDVALLAAISPPSFCATDPNKQCPPQFKVEDPKKYIDRIIAAANKRKVN